MGKFLKTLFVLAVGGGGFAGGYYVAKHIYSKAAEKEIEDVKKAFQEHYGPIEPEEKKPEEDDTRLHKIEPKSSIADISTAEKDYRDYGKLYRTASIERKLEAEKAAADVAKHNPPYVIDEATYETSDFKAATLFWYEDGVMTDGDGRMINDNEIDNMIGQDAVNHLKTGVDGDSIYVRNESLQTDFEVILEGKPYSKVDSNARVIPEDYE